MLKIRGPQISKLIKYFIFADLMLFAGWGFVSPIFSIFIIEEIAGATLVTVGVATAIAWTGRSIIPLVVSNVLDKREGEKDDFYTLVFSLGVTSLTAFALAAVATVNQLYLVYAVHGAAIGIYSVAWAAIFSRHLDKHRPAFDWSLDKAALGMAIAVSGLLGAEVASRFGFDVTFLMAGILSLISAGIILLVPNLILPPPERKKAEGFRPHLHRRHGPPGTNV